MKFTLNGREFETHYVEYRTGYYWSCDGGIESKGYFDTALEAQQDAIRHAEEEYNMPSDWADKQTKLFCRE